MTEPRPPFDPELKTVLGGLDDLLRRSLTPELIRPMRSSPMFAPIDDLLAQRAITRRDLKVPGYQGDEIWVSVLERHGSTGRRPGIYNIHGGGMVMGDRMSSAPLDWIEHFDAVCVTVEYRLAPEYPDPFPVEDCYAGLLWTVEHSDELGIDRGRLILAGGSAGGGLAAGTALLNRDRGDARLAGQLLMYPMLDDRNRTVSSQQFDGDGGWDRTSNETGWKALLGERFGSDNVSIYAAPGRAEDLSGLPPAYIDCGSAEVFRDEDVAYASQLWASGVQAELHVWPGAFHGCDVIAPAARISQLMIASRRNWLKQLLG